jgi:hypothetical protein
MTKNTSYAAKCQKEQYETGRQSDTESTFRHDMCPDQVKAAKILQNLRGDTKRSRASRRPMSPLTNWK